MTPKLLPTLRRSVLKPFRGVLEIVVTAPLWVLMLSFPVHVMVMSMARLSTCRDLSAGWNAMP